MSEQSKLWRVDPADCNCTDCITGESKPINKCSDYELLLLHFEALSNASGATLKLQVEYKYE